MHKIDLELAVNALSYASVEGRDAFVEALVQLSAAIGANIAAAWKYNIQLGYFSCYGRCGYEPEKNAHLENVHPAESSLLSDLFRRIMEGEKSCRYSFLTDEDIERHWAPRAIYSSQISNLIAVPFFNHSTQSESPKRRIPAGLIIFYFKHDVDYTDAFSSYVTLSFSQIYTNIFLQRKDDVTNRLVEFFSKSINEDSDRIIEEICTEIIQPAFNVEACSIYEWSAHRNGFKVASTTGLEAKTKSLQYFDKTGDSLISAAANAKKSVSIDDIKNLDKVNRLLRTNLSEESLVRNAEKTITPARSVLLVPVFNPIANRESTVSAVIKLVNKRLTHAGIVDFFDHDDVLIAEEVATMIALHEEQSRSARQQIAFALQFGHEAQAPAVGIKGAADRIMLKLARGDVDQVSSMAQDIFDFAEMLIAFSESLAFGFGDRSLPKAQRYTFRQFNLRKAIDAAKKVVIPICRAEKLQFDNIYVVGSFPLIFADQRAFMQIFYNLLTNAIKYRSREVGDIFRIQISSRFYSHADFLSRDRDDQLKRAFDALSAQRLVSNGIHVIDVSDYGIGVPEDETTKVFIQGFRSPLAGISDIRGSGIGLAIVKNILLDFDSFIWVTKSRDPTTFRIVIPDALESGLYSRRVPNRRI